MHHFKLLLFIALQGCCKYYDFCTPVLCCHSRLLTSYISNCRARSSVSSSSTRRLADTSLGGSNGNGVGLSVRHKKPHLLVGDMTARHERSSLPGKPTHIRTRHDRQTHPIGAKRRVRASPVGLRPSCETPTLRYHLD